SDSPDARWDNRRKILWSLYHILRDDVRRRFVFGYTIENRKMRWWYCSRTEVFVSTPLDFIQDHRSVVEFLLCVAFAEEHQLGWDPTIKRLPPTPIHPLPRYEITVRDTLRDEVVERTYRTKDLIWNYGADAFRGRGTRVWSVVEVDADGNEGTDLYILKDSWADVDREREGRINQLIHSRVVEQDEELASKVYARFFMQVHAFGDVHIGPRVDRTDNFKVDRFGEELLSRGTLTVLVRTDDEGNPQDVKLPRRGVPVVTRSIRPREPVLHYSHKVHHRTVFKDAGKDLLEVDTLVDVYRRIEQVLSGLDVLHSANWVHRDISYGNILVVGENAKITDLEYAKAMSDLGAHHGVRTGTPYFMSEEVRASGYNYMPVKRRNIRLTDSSRTERLRHALRDPAATPPHVQPSQQESGPGTIPSSAPNEAADAALPPPDTTHPSRVIFRHNPLHDLESVLWLSLFVLLVSEYENSELNEKGERKYDAQTFQAFMDAQQALAWKLFCEPNCRMAVMMTANYLARQTDGLHPTVAKIICELDFMCSDLVDAFKDAEKDLKPGVAEPITMDWSAVNGQLSQSIMAVISILEQTPLHLLKDTTKRTRRLVKPKGVGNEKKGRGVGDTANVDGDSGTDEDQDGRRVKVRRVGGSKDVSSSSRAQLPIPSLTTLIAADHGSDSEQ
ncbi:uncharacterized protein PHACADRAFT_266377, partial [Phanerochaete carnosa HHB-10118-sp]